MTSSFKEDDLFFYYTQRRLQLKWGAKREKKQKTVMLAWQSIVWKFKITEVYQRKPIKCERFSILLTYL